MLLRRVSVRRIYVSTGKKEGGLSTARFPLFQRLI